MISSRRLIWTAALLVFAACRVLPPAAGLDRAGQTVLGIAAAMALLWALDAAPLGVTSLLALVLLGTVPGLRPTQVFGGFAFPVVFLLTGGIASMTAASLLGGFSWLRWFVLMAVPYYALLTLGAIALWLTSRAAGLEHRPVAERAVHTPVTGPERRTLVVLLLTTTLWL